MKVLGIIAEYNPFHNGHLYHLNESKKISECTHTIAIMSGHFLQRGEPALIDKWKRAEIAVKNGIDLVLELPYAFSCQSAEIFAYGSIKTLDELGLVDVLAFGSESGKIAELERIAFLLANESDVFKTTLHEKLKQGFSFPKARELAIERAIGGEIQIDKSNDILGIEYLKWLYRLNSKIKPMAVKRTKVGYHSNFALDGIASATFIRNLIFEDPNWSEKLFQLVPAVTYQEVMDYKRNHEFNKLEHYSKEICYSIIRSNILELKSIPDVSEGIENKLYACGSKSKNMDELIKCVNSKRYTYTRISRILCHLMNNYGKTQMDDFFKSKIFKPYARVLSFNDNGREILKKISGSSDIPMVVNLGKSVKNLDEKQKQCLKFDTRSTDMFFLKSNPDRLGADFVTKPVYVKKK
ncbi:nucleotidyltransferase [Alkalibacter mobilis]|uniref:nucleotidyltransferase n=1 Tax=Alkalibacter mobilis TaxID=2787712 RepID=UPI00189D05FD|nr:nucleotidyltransferase [Alkalibacter mobilis]MBF7095843.1 nucleotidyltransferase [Alkalibacter mobilis]